MHENTAKVVYPVLMHGLRLRERVEGGESPDLMKEQQELMGKLGSGSEPARDWSAAAGDSVVASRRLPSRPAYHYALVCWLDEIFSDKSPWGVRWTEKTLEHALYGTRGRAYKFWEEARRAEAATASDDVEVFYLCVMLGYRGDLRDDPQQLASWCEAVERRLADSKPEDWTGRPPEREAPSYAPPLHGRERLQRMLSVVIAALLLLIPAATFFLVLWTAR
jgi:type VI secretion system protein ImpK